MPRKTQKIVPIRNVPLLPPLSQSRQADMACPRAYFEKHVLGRRTPTTEAAERGTNLHRAVADYVHHLVENRLRSDLGYLKSLMPGLTAEEQEVLQTGLGDFEIDPNTVVGTEVHIRLTDHFQVLDPDEGAVAGLEGTLDLVQLHSPVEAEITDYKSWYKVEDAKTYQGMHYAVLLMCANLKIQLVRFVLRFIRWGVVREEIYTREEAVYLGNRVSTERNRQAKMHDAGLAIIQGNLDVQKLPAHPGRHCLYCPLLYDGRCPLGKENPMAMNPAERVKFAVWVEHARKQNLEALKAHVAENGPVRVKDDNGNAVEALFVAQTRSSYPLLAAAPILDSWAVEHEDVRPKVTVGGLSAILKAKQRAALKEALGKVALVKGGTRFKLTGTVEEQEE